VVQGKVTSTVPLQDYKFKQNFSGILFLFNLWCSIDCGLMKWLLKTLILVVFYFCLICDVVLIMVWWNDYSRHWCWCCRKHRWPHHVLQYLQQLTQTCWLVNCSMFKRRLMSIHSRRRRQFLHIPMYSAMCYQKCHTDDDSSYLYTLKYIMNGIVVSQRTTWTLLPLVHGVLTVAHTINESVFLSLDLLVVLERQLSRIHSHWVLTPWGASEPRPHSQKLLVRFLNLIAGKSQEYISQDTNLKSGNNNTIIIVINSVFASVGRYYVTLLNSELV